MYRGREREREREGERERERDNIYIYIYREREREKEREIKRASFWHEGAREPASSPCHPLPSPPPRARCILPSMGGPRGPSLPPATGARFLAPSSAGAHSNV